MPNDHTISNSVLCSDNRFPFQRLDAYRCARSLAELVHHAAIRDAELRDQATRAAKSAFLNLCEGLPNDRPAMRRKYFESADGSLHETVGAVDLADAIGAIDARAAAEIHAEAFRLRAMLRGLLRATGRARLSSATSRSATRATSRAAPSGASPHSAAISTPTPPPTTPPTSTLTATLTATDPDPDRDLDLDLDLDLDRDPDRDRDPDPAPDPAPDQRPPPTATSPPPTASSPRSCAPCRGGRRS